MIILFHIPTKCHKHFYINGIIYLQMYAKTIRYIYPFQNYSYILCDSYSLYTKCVKWRNWLSIPSKLCTNSMGSGLSERKFQFPIALMFTYFHFDYESHKFKAFWYDVFIIRIYSYRLTMVQLENLQCRYRYLLYNALKYYDVQ